jgi:hypothetical protein
MANPNFEAIIIGGIVLYAFSYWSHWSSTGISNNDRNTNSAHPDYTDKPRQWNNQTVENFNESETDKYELENHLGNILIRVKGNPSY